MIKLIIFGLSCVASSLCTFQSGYLLAEKKIFDTYDVIEGDYVPYKVEYIDKKEDFKVVEDEKTKEENPFEGLDIPPISEKESNQYRKSFVDYAKLGRDPRSKRSEDDKIDDYREPYLITEDEYDQGNRHFDKIIVNYFEDGVFVDDQTDEPDPGVEKYLGVNIKEAFGYGTEDNDMAFVRNERLGADYNIVRKHQTYKEYIGSD